MLYDRFGLPIYFRLPDPFTPPELRQALVLAGYEEFDPTFVMGRAIDNVEPFPTEIELHEMDPVDWLELRAWMTGTPLVRLGHHAAVLRVILPEKVLLGLMVGGQPVACGMGVVEGKLLGYFSIYTRRSARRCGYGKAMMSALSEWGKANGADYGYLQVEGHNAPALAMYERLGFERLYRYLYCKKV